MIGDIKGDTRTQRAQYPLIKEYTLNGTRVPNMNYAIFLN